MSNDSLTNDELIHVNDVVQAFVATWSEGTPPSLEDCFGKLKENCQTFGFRRLLEADLRCRREHRLSLGLQDYLDRFDDFSDIIKVVWREQVVGDETEPNTSLPHRDKSSNGPETDFDLEAIEFESKGKLTISTEVARGGMGAILLGHDSELGRDLAIKVLLARHRNNEEVAQRFIEEAQIGGQLQHPGIAPVYGMGQLPDERPFFSMKLVKGNTFAQLLSKRKSPKEDQARFLDIFHHVCQTMAYAHSRHVIHRDLKPQNIMVGAFGEVQVMDWGLAKVLGKPAVSDTLRAVERKPSDVSVIRTSRDSSTGVSGSTAHTSAGSILGTPAYMSPEQAMGETETLTEQTDVFGLGAILCEILTLHPPYTADSATNVLKRATSARLSEAHQRLDECDADDELVQLARMCLATEASDRPANAAILVEYLEKYLQSVEERLRDAELEAARAQSRAIEEQKRRRISLALAAVILIAFISGGGGWMFVRRQQNQHEQELAKANQAKLQKETELAEQRARDQQQRAEQELRFRKQADEQRKEAQGHLHATRLRLAQRAYEDGQIGQLRELLELQNPQTDGHDFRGWEWYFLKEQTKQLSVLESHNARVTQLLWIANGERLVSLDELGGIKTWDMTQEQPELLRTVSSAQTYRTIHPDGQRVATLSRGGGNEVQIISLLSGKKIRAFRGPDRRTHILHWHPDGKRFAFVVDKKDIIIWDSETESEVFELKGHREDVRALDWSPDGSQLVSVGNDETTRLWSLESGKELFSERVKVHDEDIWDVDFSPDGTMIASAGSDYHVSVIDAKTGKLIARIRPALASIRGIAFSKDNLLAIGSDTSNVDVWQVSPSKRIRTLRGHSSKVETVAWHPSHNWLASGSVDQMVNIWNLDTVPNPKSLRCAEIHAIAWGDSGKTIAAAGPRSKVFRWDAGSGTPQPPLEGHKNTIHSMSWQTKGDYVATGARYGTIYIWNAQSGESVALPKQDIHVKVLQWSTSGKILATNATKQTGVTLWDTTTPMKPKLARYIELELGGIRDIAFTNDDQRIAVAGEKAVVLVNVDSGKVIQEFVVGRAHNVSVGFRPDGAQLAIGNYDGVVSIYSLSSKTPVWQMRGHRGPVRSVKWHPQDPRRIATGSDDGTVRVWDTETGHELLVFEEHRSAVTKVEWSPDGQSLASGSHDETVKVWTTNR